MRDRIKISKTPQNLPLRRRPIGPRQPVEDLRILSADMPVEPKDREARQTSPQVCAISSRSPVNSDATARVGATIALVLATRCDSWAVIRAPDQALVHKLDNLLSGNSPHLPDLTA